MIQVLKEVAPILAVLLPAIGAFFAYRRQENRRDRPASAGKIDMHAIGGLLADSSLVERQVAAMEMLAHAVGNLASIAKDSSLAVKRLEQFDKIIDETRDIRRALEEISNAARQQKRPDAPRIPGE